MAHILQKGVEFTIGTDENTIQSFNGGLGGSRSNMYVDIVLDNQDITSVAVQVSGNQEFSVTVPGQSGASRFEAGDTLEIYSDADRAGTLHNAEIVSVTHSGADVVLSLRITDPHDDQHAAVSAAGFATSQITRNDQFVSFTGITFTPAIPTGLVPLYAGDIESIVLTGDFTAQAHLLRGVVAYEWNGTNIIFTYNNSANAIDGVIALQGAIGTSTTATVTLNYVTTTETFDKIDAEHHIHVGSKTPQTVATVTPITLPAGVTIRSGSGVGDIFLVKVTE